MSKAANATAKRLAIAAAAALSFTPLAQASVIVYDFTVSITSGPLKGQVDNGSFSYSSLSIPPSDVNRARGLLTALDFNFEGVAYTARSANTGALVFDAADRLSTALFGTNCNAGSCFIDPDAGGEWFVSGASFSYTDAPFHLGSGAVTYKPVSSGLEPASWAATPSSPAVPEPTIWVMMAIGFAGLAFGRLPPSRTSAALAG